MPTNTKTKSVYFNTRIHMYRSEQAQKYVTSSVVKFLERTRTGSGLPHFKDKILNHENATTFLTAVENTLDSVPCYMKVNFKYDAINGFNGQGIETHTHYITGDLAGLRVSEPIPQFAWTATAYNRARNKYLSAARNAQQSVSAPIFLGELRQTYRMLRHPAEALSRLIDSYYVGLISAKRRDRLNWAKAVHGLWLEHSFGWKPLMADIAGAKSALQRIFERETVKPITASAIDRHLKSSTSGVHGVDASVFKIGSSYYTQNSEQYQVRYKGAVLVHATTTAQQEAAVWGFTPREFLPTVWELLPWSFLVDYFASIGDFLDANGTLASDIIWTSQTERKTTENLYVESYDPDYTKSSLLGSAYLGGHGSTGRALWRKRTVTRQSVATPLPQLYVKWAGPGYGQCANMSALFGQFCGNLHSQNPSRRNYRL